MARMIFILLSVAVAANSSPVAKVIELLDELTGKVRRCFRPATILFAKTMLGFSNVVIGLIVVH